MIKKWERIFYFAAITAEFIIILFLSSMLSNLKREASNKIKDLDKKGSIQRLFSFSGNSIDGNNELIHFTAYSQDYYLFAILSTDCSRCVIFWEKMKLLSLSEEIVRDVKLKILILDSENWDETILKNDVLKISWDDWIQFGLNPPTLLAVNGKGEILFRYTGYSEGIFETALEKIHNSKFKTSTSID